MIEITRINGSKMTLNADMIELVEETPDTVITLNNGKKYVVSESRQEITDKFIEHKRQIYVEGPAFIRGE